MKSQLLTLLGLLLFTAASAQKPDSALAMVHYKYTWLRDTTAKDKPYTENMVLVLGKNASVYKSYDRKMQMAQMRQQIKEQMSAGGNIQVSSRSESSNKEFFIFPNENKLLRKDRIITTYLVEEPFPVINWKISSDTMTVGNLSCQKATGHFAGRDYTAWFCADLPYRSGPWKLTGLPGLIVEAYDTKKEVVFKFDGIEKVTPVAKTANDMPPATGGMRIVTIGMDEGSEDPNLIALPTSAVKVTEKELANLKEAMRKDPSAFVQSAMAGSGMNTRPGSGVNMKVNIQPGAQPTVNNPVELPEKK
ncbi:GLPGLI family protein [Mucilaginibacter gracilis]|uniref:GLPGLI family protein n=1 Tax=Mucilaginibacter gracilis TaxID=423350 RepID=A0A495J9B3_9SPHI|nr:GLPGLI family protein [Mucilaginibacter gracilis]RKR85068.1 GLPGLI family protein [Mucilaginibacter gracilis]